MDSIGISKQRRYSIEIDDDVIDTTNPALSGLGGVWAVSKLAFLPEMTDVKSIELMKVLSVMASFAFITNPAIFAMCACKMVQLTLLHGSCPTSCLGFIYFAFYQATFDNFRTAQEFGMTARALSDRYGKDGMAVAAGRTLLCHAAWVAKWSQPLTVCGPQIVQSYHDLLAAGDVLCATVAALMKVTHDVWTGESLPTLLSEADHAHELLTKRCPLKSLPLLATCASRFAMVMMGQTASAVSIDDPEHQTPSPTLPKRGSQGNLNQTQSLKQTQSISPVGSPTGSSPPNFLPTALHTSSVSFNNSTSTTTVPDSPPVKDKEPKPVFLESVFLDCMRTQTGRMRYAHTCWHYVFRLKALYLLECYSEAYTVARDCKLLIHHLAGQTHVVLYHFYHALTLVQLIKRAEADVKLRDGFMSDIKESCTVLRKWSESAPFNFAHRFHLVRAEVARISGRMEKAQGLYEQSIMSCRNQGFIHQEALAGIFLFPLIITVDLFTYCSS